MDSAAKTMIAIYGLIAAPIQPLNQQISLGKPNKGTALGLRGLL